MDARQLAKFNAVQKCEDDKSAQGRSQRSKKSGKRDHLEFAPPLLIPIQKKKKAKWTAIYSKHSLHEFDAGQLFPA